MRVVVVEPAESDALYGFAAGRGWEVESAGSVGEAVAVARERRPDVVLFDVWVTGPAAAAEVVGAIAALGIPVVVIAAMPTLFFIRDVLLAGAFDVLVKPLAAERVVEVVERAAGRAGGLHI